MTRLDYLKDRYSFNKILDGHECKEFSEYTIRCGGSVFVVRIYGNETMGFRAMEK